MLSSGAMLMSTGMLGPISAMFLCVHLPSGLLVDQHELPGERGRGEGVRVIREQRPPQLERRARDREHLQRLARVEVPHDDRRAELLHGLAVLQELADRPHVVLPPRERRREHAVQVDVDPHVVAVDRLRGHPDRPDELALVAVLGQPGPATAVLGVGQGRDQHPARQRVERVRAYQAAGVLHEGLDRLHQLRLAGFEATSKMKIWLVSSPPAQRKRRSSVKPAWCASCCPGTGARWTI